MNQPKILGKTCKINSLHNNLKSYVYLYLEYQDILNVSNTAKCLLRKTIIPEIIKQIHYLRKVNFIRTNEELEYAWFEADKKDILDYFEIDETYLNHLIILYIN